MKSFYRLLVLTSLLTFTSILFTPPYASAGNGQTNAAPQKIIGNYGDGFKHVPNCASARIQTPAAQPDVSPFAAARRNAQLRARHYSDSELWERAYNAGRSARRRHYFSYCCDPFWWPRFDFGWNWGGHHRHHPPRPAPPPHHRR